MTAGFWQAPGGRVLVRVVLPIAGGAVIAVLSTVMIWLIDKYVH